MIILRKWLMVAGSELIYIYQTRSGCDMKMYPTTGLRPDGSDCGGWSWQGRIFATWYASVLTSWWAQGRTQEFTTIGYFHKQHIKQHIAARFCWCADQICIHTDSQRDHSEKVQLTYKPLWALGGGWYSCLQEGILANVAVVVLDADMLARYILWASQLAQLAPAIVSRILGGN